MSTPPAQLCRCFWAPGFAGETSSAQSFSHVRSAVTFDDALVFRVGSSLASNAIVPDLSSWIVQDCLLNRVFDSGLGS